MTLTRMAGRMPTKNSKVWKALFAVQESQHVPLVTTISVKKSGAS